MSGRGKLVCIVGIDGSGKSTLARRLVRERRGANGRPFRYLWFRSPLQLAASRLLTRLSRKGRQAGAVAGESWRPGRPTLASRLYQAAVWSDYLLLQAPRVLLARWAGRNLVCDRYAHDIAVDLGADYGAPPDVTARRLRRVHRAFPSPDLLVLVDVPEEVSLARKDDVPNRDFLATRRKGYQEMAHLPGVVSLDGTLPHDAVYAQVERELARRGVVLQEADA